jgi:hypothetical protein
MSSSAVEHDKLKGGEGVGASRQTHPTRKVQQEAESAQPCESRTAANGAISEGASDPGSHALPSPPPSIRIVIEIAEPYGRPGAVGVSVDTVPFDKAVTPDDIGAVWVGICLALNTHLQSRGFKDFDCLKAHRADLGLS